MDNHGKISVGSSRDYDDLIAEIKFGLIAGMIVSKEPSDTDYMVSIHSFDKNAVENFDYNKNISGYKIALCDLLQTLNEAKDRLECLNSKSRN